MQFTRTNGEIISVNSNDVSVVESNAKYTVYGAKHNPSGEQLLSVEYKGGEIIDEAGMGGDMGETIEELDVDQVTESLPNPPKGSKTFDWRNLRLQSAIDGEHVVTSSLKQVVSRTFRVAEFRGSFKVDPKQSIRDSPMLFLVSAKDWYNYINRMETIDIGAEFAAGVSHAQRASIALFATEWENDPGHAQLNSRLLPGADQSDAVAKAQIAYDVLTKGHEILGKRGYGQNNNDRMFKLCFDILQSLPVKQYNFYTLYQVHPDEGDEIYREFKSRYVPLDTTETEMVNEMMIALETEGDGYAFRTTRNESLALNAAKLMKTAVASYEIGDTVTTRTVLMTLSASPYNYTPRSLKQSYTASGDDTRSMRTDTDVEFVTLKVQKGDQVVEDMLEKNHATLITAETIGVYAVGLKEDDFKKQKYGRDSKERSTYNIETGNRTDPLKLTTGPTDIVPAYLAIRGKGKKGGTWNIVKFDEALLKTSRDANKRKPRSMRSGAKKNPKGRGKLFYVELHPKTRLNMKRREPGEGRALGETRHGQGKSKKGQTYWSKGVNKSLPEYQMLQMGVLKSTGEEAPFRIRFPTSHFAVINHPTLGYKTIIPKKQKSDKAFMKSWDNFLKQYGVPKLSPSKDTYYRFIIPKNQRLKSPYYQSVRVTAGKKTK